MQNMSFHSQSRENIGTQAINQEHCGSFHLYLSAHVIYCITCTFYKKLYIGEIEWRLGDRFREHPRDVQKDEQNASKPVARHFNLLQSP